VHKTCISPHRISLDFGKLALHKITIVESREIIRVMQKQAFRPVKDLTLEPAFSFRITQRRVKIMLIVTAERVIMSQSVISRLALE
jgi:hypothetical protein